MPPTDDSYWDKYNKIFHVRVSGRKMETLLLGFLRFHEHLTFWVEDEKKRWDRPEDCDRDSV